MTSQPESREYAASAGKVIYVSDVPCGKCGSPERYVSSGSCAPCIRKSTAERHAKIRELRMRAKSKKLSR